MGKENLRVPTSEEARENGRRGGIASGEARARKRALADVVRSVLDEEVGELGKTRLDAIVEKTLRRLYEHPTIKDIETLQRILGESVVKLDVMTDEDKQKAIREEMAKVYGE